MATKMPSITAEEYDLEEIVRHVKRGRPEEGILAYVEANDVDVVVMGTTGREGETESCLEASPQGSCVQRRFRLSQSGDPGDNRIEYIT